MLYRRVTRAGQAFYFVEIVCVSNGNLADVGQNPPVVCREPTAALNLELPVTLAPKLSFKGLLDSKICRMTYFGSSASGDSLSL